MQPERNHFVVEKKPQEVDFGEYNRWYLDVILAEAKVVRDRLTGHPEIATTFTVDEGRATQAELSVRVERETVYIHHLPSEDGEASAYGYQIESGGLVVVDDADVERAVDMALLDTAPVLTGAHRLAFLAARLLK